MTKQNFVTLKPELVKIMLMFIKCCEWPEIGLISHFHCGIPILPWNYFNNVSNIASVSNFVNTGYIQLHAYNLQDKAKEKVSLQQGEGEVARVGQSTWTRSEEDDEKGFFNNISYRIYLSDKPCKVVSRNHQGRENLRFSGRKRKYFDVAGRRLMKVKRMV